jgi:hypothetical protein
MDHSAHLTIARSEGVHHEAQRHAYNAAFESLGLTWHWDSETYAALGGQGPLGLRRYLESHHPHLLRAYDADFLVQAIESAKARCHASAVRIPRPAPARPGHARRGLQQAA